MLRAGSGGFGGRPRLESAQHAVDQLIAAERKAKRRRARQERLYRVRLVLVRWVTWR